MTATLIGIGVLAVILAWFFWPSAAPAKGSRRDRPDVDEAELEAAEREVQDASDAESVRDWGPGAGRKPLP